MTDLQFHALLVAVYAMGVLVNDEHGEMSFDEAIDIGLERAWITHEASLRSARPVRSRDE